MKTDFLTMQPICDEVDRLVAVTLIWSYDNMQIKQKNKINNSGIKFKNSN